MADQSLPTLKASAADVTAVILFSLPPDMAIGGSDHTWDDAGNLFVAYATWPSANSNSTMIVVNKYAAPVNLAALSPPTWSTRVFPPTNHKLTGNPTLGHRGTMLTVECSAYVWPSTLPRIAAPIAALLSDVYVTASAPPPPPPPVTGDLVITSPAAVVGTWRRVSSGFDRALAEMEENDNGNDNNSV